MPFAPHVLVELETALTECFPYHISLDNFIIRSGFGAERLASVRSRAESRNKTLGRFNRAPKRFVAQELILELGSGVSNDDRIVALLIDSLCKGSFPEAPTAGLAAINQLRAMRTIEKSEAAERRAEFEYEQRAKARQRDEERSARESKREALLRSFLDLCAILDSQQRAFALERFLNSLFDFEDLAPRASLKIVGEQIDGSFAWASRTHLVEAKWVKVPVAGAEFGAFMYKLAGKTAYTRGLYLSVNGYSQQAIAGLKGKPELRFVCIDGSHLLRSLQPEKSLAEILRILWRHADETGEAYLPVSSSAFLNRET